MQRSRAVWLKDGDKNTTFFRTKATERSDKKFIEYLEKEDGSIITKQESILEEFINSYNSLFSVSTWYSHMDCNSMMRHILPKVSEAMNGMLLEPFTMEEISRALFQMHHDKALGIDDFSVLFF